MHILSTHAKKCSMIQNNAYVRDGIYTCGYMYMYINKYTGGILALIEIPHLPPTSN